MALQIRALAAGDPPVLEKAFAEIGWTKPAALYERYLDEQERGKRSAWVASVGGRFAGYVTLNRAPDYPPFREAGLAEIQDLNVLPAFRRRGVATALVETAERAAADGADEVGIGVGLHPGYNAAQRMYVVRGYVPDARGVFYDNRPVEEGESVVMDDELVLHFTKSLSRDHR